MRTVATAEQRLADLQAEKDQVWPLGSPGSEAALTASSPLQLESALQRTPRAGGRVTHQAKQKQVQSLVTCSRRLKVSDLFSPMQLAMESRLEEVLREIGSTRMVLRSHHALRK